MVFGAAHRIDQSRIIIHLLDGVEQPVARHLAEKLRERTLLHAQRLLQGDPHDVELRPLLRPKPSIITQVEQQRLGLRSGQHALDRL